MATLTQISNALNIMVQQPNSGLAFYHWGYRYDINREITNNYNPKNRTGRLYPALQMDVPDYLSDIKAPSYGADQKDIQMILYFDKLQDRDNLGKLDTRNTIEQIDYLDGIARVFMANWVEVVRFYSLGFIKTNPRYTPRTNLHNPKLITLEVSFVLTTQLECVEESDKIDLNALPVTLSKIDIENTIA